MLEAVKTEEIKYEQVCSAVLADPSPYTEHSMFDHGKFWSAHKLMLPIHYALWVAEVGSAKVASANIETVFSGAGRISQKSRKLSPELLSDYAFCHYNYKYEWLRPTLDEIVTTYKRLYGKQAVDGDGDSNSGDSSEEEEASEAEEGKEEGEEAGVMDDDTTA